jgi:glycosyltransferase involved in cell wall biosynthesis
LIVPGGVDPSGTRRVVPCLLWLIKRLARQHDLQVIALFQDGAPAQYALLGATVHHIGRKQTGIRAFKQIASLHGVRRFDVLHAIWGSPAGLLAALTARILRRPMVLHLFGGELVSMPDVGYGELRTSKGRRRMELALGSAARLTVQSQSQLERLKDRGWPAERLPMGVDLEAWPLVPPRSRPYGRPARLVHVASLNAVKDQSTLLQAAKLLERNGTGFRLDIVGEDTLDGRIQEQARACGLENHVRFHGFLEQHQLRPLMLDADMLVMSSRSEAGPVVLAEAAACGVPTVGTAVGQIAEWSPEAAVAVPIAEPETLAGEISSLLEDEPRRLRIAAAAQQRAASEDADWTAAGVSRVYQEVVSV